MTVKILFLLSPLINLINPQPFLWPFDEEGYVLDYFHCSGNGQSSYIPTENVGSTSYSALETSPPNWGSEYEFENRKIYWNDIYDKLEALRGRLEKYNGKYNEFIKYMNYLEAKLRETVKDKLGVENLIIEINIFLRNNQQNKNKKI
uniref:Uncharacterized protein n=1 Tax=Meloidogyne enterolobii TaxID=390850 RepID=A0A6V7UG28_MELEN|nr:unnamed protein product [Meloidogyne enterolobii]